jgi:cbb3-type cytochrome oxidase subunit 3
MLLWGLVAVVACSLAIILYRIWSNRRKTVSTAASEAILPVPDVADENVGADQLPEDGWTKLARELLSRGELRLAMRAFYLASLSHLAARNLISIARFKSNRDYERELRRRGHSFPELLSIFGQNISVFEGIWYGMHEVSHDSVDRFALNVERIKTAE